MYFSSNSDKEGGEADSIRLFYVGIPIKRGGLTWIARGGEAAGVSMQPHKNPISSLLT